MADLLENTAITVSFGPFLDKDDGVTPVEDLASTMIVYRRKSGSFAPRASTGAITYDRDGFYNVPLTAADVGSYGLLRLESSDSTIHVPVWQDYDVVTFQDYISGSGELRYTTPAEVRAYKVAGLRIRDLVRYTDLEIASKIRLSASIIEGVTGDIFYPRDATYTFDGNGLAKLFFIPTVSLRLLSATSVIEVDIDGTTELEEYEEDDDFKLYPYYLELVSDYTDRPRVRVGRGGCWPKGQNNISIEGSWGRSAVPDEIKEAAILLTLERLLPGSTRMASTDVRKAEWDDFSITFKGGDDLFGAATGFDEVDRLLRNHVNFAPTFLSIPDERGVHDNGPGTFFRI